MKNMTYTRRLSGKSFRLAICGIALSAALLSGSGADAAGNRVKGQYATTEQPYWKVGKMDKTLSGACQRGEFRQRKVATYSVGFIGEQGRGLTGIAHKDWNLIDPKGLAKAGYSYHFYNQGYSNCKVFVAKIPGGGS